MRPVPEPARQVLAGLAERMTPWPDALALLTEALPGADVYVGGDGLRPYVSFDDGDRLSVIGTQPAGLPLPPFIRDLLAGDYGLPRSDWGTSDGGQYLISVPKSASLTRRLQVPRVLLVGLGDVERYRGARLPLGVARLAQWLRYTHAAEVEVVDYNFTRDPLDSVHRHLSGGHVDILGISVNFGQWLMLEELAKLVNKIPPSAVVLGNILAAFSPAEAAAPFAAVPKDALLVATGLGEYPLEALCRSLHDPASWPQISGLIRPNVKAGDPAAARRALPPELVFPDDSLILDVVDRGGQISLETSFGCQYGACTFCPRDHRGEGWSRGTAAAVMSTLERVAPTRSVVSFVDEEFFGSEGLVDPPLPDLPAAAILAGCRQLGITYEIYTRLEQLFDRRRSREWNLDRARLLAREAAQMRRIFVGVESGSPGQLRRYGKGQTITQTVDALRVASMLAVPLEFGFITFDPLLTPAELAENVSFLARRDVIATPGTGEPGELVGRVAAYLDGADIAPSGIPLYQHVSYMATELEVLARSRYADSLHRRHPELLDGSYDPGFARYGVRYRDDRIAEIAGWCRVWTEGMFTPVYEARMAARARASEDAASMVLRYRDSTFRLLVSLTSHFLPELDDLNVGGESSGGNGTSAAEASASDDPANRTSDPAEWLPILAARTLLGAVPEFDLRLKDYRRQR